MSLAPYQLCKTLLLPLTFLTCLEAYQVEINKCCPARQYYDIKNGRCVMETEAGAAEDSHWLVPLSMQFAVYSHQLNFSLGYSGSFDCMNMNAAPEAHEISMSASSDDFYFTESGILMETRSRVEPFVNHEQRHFCIDLRKDKIVIRTCPVHCNGGDLCIRKCCPVGEVFEYDNGLPEACIQSHANSRVPLLLGSEKFLPPIHANEKKKIPRFYSGHDDMFSNCSLQPIRVSSRWSGAHVKKPFNLLVNGTPSFFNSNNKRWEPFANVLDYCYEHFIGYPENEDQCNETEVLFICTKKVTSAAAEENRTPHKITLTIAIISLLVTTVILALLIEKTNLHSWTRLAYVTSHLFFMILFGFTYFHWLNPSRPGACVTFAVVFHFAGLSTICWLSVMNFDLWWTFKALKPSGDRSSHILRFLMYCLFAFGTPLVIITIASIIQSTKPDVKDNKYCLSALEDSEKFAQTFLSNGFLYPDYGKKENRRCTLSTASLPLYWYGPLSFLLIGNLVFFIATSYRLIIYQRRTRRASLESTNGSSVQAKLFVKIFIVSGVTWNTEIISWLASDGTWLWVDILHHIQAFALFVIFVCKPEVLRSLQARYPVVTPVIPLPPGVIPPVGRTRRSATLASLSTDLNTRVTGRKLSLAGSDSGGKSATLKKYESLEMKSPDVIPPEKQPPETPQL